MITFRPGEPMTGAALAEKLARELCPGCKMPVRDPKIYQLTLPADWPHRPPQDPIVLVCSCGMDGLVEMSFPTMTERTTLELTKAGMRWREPELQVGTEIIIRWRGERRDESGACRETGEGGMQGSGGAVSGDAGRGDS